MSKQNSPLVLGTERISKLLTQYAIPAIIAMTASSLYNMADSIFIGHGVGIEVNEAPVLAPRSKDILEGNQVIALEPKFVIPHVGAVGIEDTYMVTPEGMKAITNAPVEIVSLS